ncbi:MAG: shikimate dehydrogenase [Gemmataceae bacterium]|nr:shikimate dehydrogenase [Gemmataceae bacterium]MCI0743628.1 shikimate dehydrogenase [Gemmataceae bacterium]
MTDNNRPVLCAVIGRTRHKMMQIEIQEAAKRGAQLIELRLDFLAKAPDFKRLLAQRPCPMIASVRRPVDGGRFPGSEEERLMLLRQAVVAGFDWIDLETDVADQVRRYGNVKRIVSYHNMRQMPDDLEEIYERMCAQDADVVKIAVTAGQPSDNLRVLDLINKGRKPTVAHCMGDMGACSRVLSACYGSPFTYAAFNPERSFAPGMLSLDELRKTYHYEELDNKSKIFGVIGDPVGHSLSPLIHNQAFRKMNFNGVYLPFRVPRGELADFLKSFDSLGVRGYSVTIPHKESAARLATIRDPAVERIGAANTIIRMVDGWHAFNTDAQAAVESLKANLPVGPDGTPGQLQSRTVLLLGAGGVARALAHMLKENNVPLILANRTPERSQKLAEEVGCKVVDWAARHNVLCDTLVNCTSVGMHPNLDECPIHVSFLKPGLMIFDTVYTPETTMLIREAKERGCHVLTGVDMFVRQAGLQFKLFTGLEAPLELMEKLVRRALSPIAIKEEE